MHLRIGFGRKLTAQVSRLVPTQTRTQCVEEHDKVRYQELYESIALGNALADIEDDANRKWRSL